MTRKDHEKNTGKLIHRPQSIFHENTITGRYVHNITVNTTPKENAQALSIWALATRLPTRTTNKSRSQIAR